MFIYINKTLSGSLREPKNKGKVQLGNGPKVVAVTSGRLQELSKQGFNKVVVTRAARLKEWSQGVLHFKRTKSSLSQILRPNWLMYALASE